MRALIVLVNYYRDMRETRSHLLHPLTKLTPNEVKFKCTYVEQKAFDEINCMVACDTLLIYLDVNKFFDIHTAARNCQIVAVISKYGKPIAFYIRKQIVPQTRYIVTERNVAV